jgi:hypothetical protein
MDEFGRSMKRGSLRAALFYCPGESAGVLLLASLGDGRGRPPLQNQTETCAESWTLVSVFFLFF